MSKPEVPHLFRSMNTGKNGHEYQAFLGDGDACQITERLAKDHGVDVIDRLIEKLIEEGE